MFSKTTATALAVALLTSACGGGGGVYQGPDERIAQAVIDDKGAPCGQVKRSDVVREGRLALCTNGVFYLATRNGSGGWDLGVYDRRTDSTRPFKGAS